MFKLLKKINKCLKYMKQIKDYESLLKYKTFKVNQKKGINDPIFRFFFFLFYSSKKATNILKCLHNFLQKYTYAFCLNFLFLYLNNLGFKSYKLTLVGCNKTQQECLRMNLVTFYKTLIVYMAYSILIFGITFTLSIWRYISIYHIFYIIYKYFLLYKEDHYSDLAKHGQYNMIIFIFGVIIIIIIFINKYKYTSECSIVIPKKCPMDIYYGVMDFSKLLKIDCKNTDNINARNLLLKYLESDNPFYNFSKTYKFGYPSSNIYSVSQFDNIKHFNKKIISNILDYNNKDNLKYLNENNKSEIILEFSNNFKDAKINIDVNFKSNLSKIRKFKENKNSIYDNVLFIFLDTLSRAHFQRTMKKTCKLLEKYMKNNT